MYNFKGNYRPWYLKNDNSSGIFMPDAFFMMNSRSHWPYTPCHITTCPVKFFVVILSMLY
jgi:hypothetical protein